MAVTIGQIAEKVGVAKSTVSRVLSGKTGNTYIGANRQEQILRTARELGFRPNSAARAVATGRFNAVALLLSTHGWRSTLSQPLLSGVHDALAEAGHSLTLARLVDEKLTDSRFLPRILREWMCDGLLIDYNVAVPEGMSELIERHRVPSVWINAKRDFDAARPDDFQAGLDATRHLLGLGHRDIAYLDLAWEKSAKIGTRHYSKEDRLAGYRRAMGEAGLAPRLIYDVEGVTLKNLLHYTRDVLSRPDRPSAVLCYGESNIVEKAAWTVGLTVPADLSVMTFTNDPNVIDELRPTAMTIPEGEVGRRAVRLLMMKIEDPSRKLPAEVVPCPFRNGCTTAPPRREPTS